MINIYELNTLRCLTEDIVKQAVYNSSRDGVSTIFIAPESNKASIEKCVVSFNERKSIAVDNGLGFVVNSSFVNGDVVSFIKLAKRFLQMCGFVDVSGNDKTILRTAIYRILVEHKGEFKTFSKFVGRFDYIDNLIDLLGDFSRYGIGEDEISCAYSRFEDSEGAQDSVNASYLNKLYDFKLLSFYISQLNKDYNLRLMVDPMSLAHEMMVQLIKNPDMMNKRRFREFSSLIKSRFVVIGFGAVRMLTPQELAFVNDMNLLGAVIDFYPLVSPNNLAPDADNVVYSNGIKFRDSLTKLGKEVNVYTYEYDSLSVQANDSVLGAVTRGYAHRLDPEAIEENPTDAIECTAINHLDDRLGYIANEIMNLTRNKGYRYRDISIVCIDDSIVDRLKSILSLWNMDAFIDRKILISNTPVFRYVLALLKLPLRNYLLEDVISVLRVGLSGVLAEDIDLLENYCVANNITNGSRLFAQKNFISKEKYPMKTYRDEKEIPAAEYIWENIIERVLVNIRDTVEEINKETKLNKKALLTAKFVNSIRDDVELLAAELVDRKDSDRASALVRGYKEVMELLTGFTLPMNECDISQKDFCSLILIDMRNRVQGTIPLMVDSVNIIIPEQAYLTPTKVMFIVGATQENFPFGKVTEGLMTRQELEYLSSGTGIELPNKVESRNRSDFIIASLMLNSVSDKLYIVDDYSNEPSSVYSYFLNFAKEEKINCFTIPKSNVNTTEEGHDFTNCTISTDVMSELLGDSKTVSVTSMELYNLCHMKYMLENVLGINVREDTREIKVNVVGTVLHAMYETALKNICESGEGIAPFDEFNKVLESDERDKTLKEKAEEAFNQYVKDTKNINEKTPEFAVYPGRNVKRIFMYSLPYIIKDIVNTGYAPISANDFELKLLNTKEPLVFETPTGKTFKFTGSVDRVDHNAEKDTDKVVDYKSGDKRVEIEKTLAGLQIQLFAYANALAGEKNVDEVQYFPLGLKAETKKESLELEPKKSGLSKNDFDIVKKYVNHLIQQSCNDIAEGKADAIVNSKSKNGKKWKCEYCPYSGACGNNPKNPKFRNVITIEELTEYERKKLINEKVKILQSNEDKKKKGKTIKPEEVTLNDSEIKFNRIIKTMISKTEDN